MFKNMVRHVVEAKNLFLTFDYSFSRPGEDQGVLSYPALPSFATIHLLILASLRDGSENWV
jgi:hypothetical protein